MLTRRHALLAGAAGIAALALGRLTWPHSAEAAKTYEVTHTDAEWRKMLSPEAYQVLRHEGTERPFTSPLLQEHRAGTFACAGCDLPLYLVEDQVRQRHRLAELLGAARRTRSTNTTDRTFGMVRTDGALPALRRPSGPRVRRRAEADRPALLHERRGAEIRARRVRLELSAVLVARVERQRNPGPGFRSGTAASRISLPLNPGYTAA